MPAKKIYDALIINRRSGKALQAKGAENGNLVEQSEINKDDSQIWTIINNSKGTKFVNKYSGKVLDVMYAGEDNGTRLQIWDDVDSVTPLWKMRGRTYKKILNAVSGRAADIADLSDESGACVQLWDDVDGENQQWKIVPLIADEPVKPTPKALVKKPAAKKAATKKPVKKPAKKEQPPVMTKA